MNDELYRQNILDHYKHPHHFGVLDAYSVSARKINQYCGDELTVYLCTDGQVITDATFNSRGCSISVAGASMLADMLIGMKLTDAKDLTETDIYNMFGVTIGPARAKCALLAYGALQDALRT